MPEYRFVQSSNIRGVAYDDDTQQLFVEFTSGSKYRYDNVPKDVYEDFLTAPSAGRYFADNVKESYTFAKV